LAGAVQTVVLHSAMEQSTGHVWFWMQVRFGASHHQRWQL